MLTKKLSEIKQHLESIGQSKRSKDQQQLLDELIYLDRNRVVNAEIEKYTYEDTLFESFIVAKGTCPTCGKKY